MAKEILEAAGVRYSMYDFIDAVKNHPILWDHTNRDFRNRALRKVAWTQIGQELCANFEMLDSPEKDAIAKFLLNRWKGLRSKYMERLKLNLQTGSSKHVAYENELRFLIVDKPEIGNDNITLKPQQPQVEGGSAAVQQHYEENVVAKSNEHCASSTTAEEYNVVDADPNILFFNSSINSSMHGVVEADPDRAFFNSSVKPHMQRMSVDVKLDFQFEVIEILRSIRPHLN